jgi:3'(2'), 5'-bisphosphate nucleotidase
MAEKLERELRVALAAVRDAAVVCRRVQTQITPEVIEKKDRSPVTVADFASQAAVCRIIGDAFPNDPIIAEEDSAFLRKRENQPFLESVQRELAAVMDAPSADDVLSWIDRGGANEFSQRFWTLDPIDGTKGFLRGEQYAVSLALIVDGQIQLGVLGCPNLSMADAWDRRSGALFSAVRGGGAQLRPLDNEQAAPQTVRVSGTARPSAARMCESVESGHSSHSDSGQIADLLGMSSDPVRLDSQAKYAVVARGEADIYLRLPTRKGYREKIWDHAGGVLVVEESGGVVTDVHGRPLEFTCGSELAANEGVIVTNGALHQAVLDAVRAVLGGDQSA